MARPINVNQLLGNLENDKQNGNGIKKEPLGKAKFLSKNERNALLSETNVNSNKSSLINAKSVIETIIVPKKESSGHQLQEFETQDTHSNQDKALKRKKSKFNFDWETSEDTSANKTPLTSLKVDDLLKQKGSSRSNKQLNKLEESYIGKHWTQKKFEEMTERDWRILKEDFQITIRADSLKQPLRNWTELKLIPKGLCNIIINDLKFQIPTPIQRATIPNFNLNKSLLGVASTGSGKTFAFIIPILTKLNQSPDRPRSIKVLEGPKALILAPTRELAQQIKSEAEKLTTLWHEHDYKIVSLVGGHSTEQISHELSDGCDILVATPGRLIDCLENHMLTIGSVATVVLDEADKMIDLGFEEQLTTILNILDIETTASNKNRQIMMFTATMTPPIEKLSRQYLNHPIHISIGGADDAVPKIQQRIIYAPTDDMKFKNLIEQLNKSGTPIIIFINHKRVADILAEKLRNETNYRIVTLHGSKSQDQREKALNDLKTNKAQIMIATSIAARGLDIPNVSLVVNFEMPKNFEEYVHRIGRTGRAGRTGVAITFIGEYENERTIEKLLKYTEKEDPLRCNEYDKRIKKLYNLGDTESEYIIY
ncbi:mRNA splicing protein prp28 [Maudiozyma exigua]|uniref:RNA helicase n=1 Tax=Maudiozyma exigua TaxID=34358 RepID=A0A9P7BCU8_MAUEX|nr:mRNA splicing protein prp28 [Kazachstania exigua]